MSVSDAPDKELVINVVRVAAIVFMLAGCFLASIGKLFGWVLIDERTDLMLGGTMVFIGGLEFYLVPYFLKRRHMNND